MPSISPSLCITERPSHWKSTLHWEIFIQITHTIPLDGHMHYWWFGWQKRIYVYSWIHPYCLMAYILLYMVLRFPYVRQTFSSLYDLPLTMASHRTENGLVFGRSYRCKQFIIGLYFWGKKYQNAALNTTHHLVLIIQVYLILHMKDAIWK